jgi:hypothetical protein
MSARICISRAKKKAEHKAWQGVRPTGALRACRDLGSPRTAELGVGAETIGATPYNGCGYPDKGPRLDSLTDGLGRRNVRG